MTVAELIVLLAKLPQDCQVIVYNKRGERREPKPNLSPLGSTVVLAPGKLS